MILISIVAAVLLLEIVAWMASALSASLLDRPIPTRSGFLRFQSDQLRARLKGGQFRTRFHATRGWESNQGQVVEGEFINSKGLRSRTEYPPERDPGVTRISVFGDSFVHGAEMADDDCWPRMIERTWKAEVLNHGVGGYGVDQCWIRFGEEGAAPRPEIVIIGLTTVMAARLVSRYRRFENPRDGALFKPRFVLEDDGLRLIPAPVPSAEAAERLLAHPEAVTAFGRDDFWYMRAMFEYRLYRHSATYRFAAYTWFRYSRRYLHPNRIQKGHLLNPDSEAFRLMERITLAFAASIRRIGAEPLVLMLPMRSDIEYHRDLGTAPYEPMRQRLDGAGLRVIDPVSEFLRRGPLDTMFNSFGHYSPQGNQLIAETVAKATDLVAR